MNRILFALASIAFLACEDIPRTVLEATTALPLGDDPRTVAPTALTIPALGAADPVVVVSVFTDYECPNCRRMHDVAARLLDRWPDTVQVQFRQLPLDDHERAEPTAVAALAAHRQGAFACMHAALIKTRPAWRKLHIAELRDFFLRALVPWCGLDAERFARDLDDPAVLTFVRKEREIARDLDVPGTPTVLVNGLEARLWPRAGVEPILLLNALVRRGLRDAEAAQREGVPLGLVDRVQANLGDYDKAALLLGISR
jgi:protein-disulfide isomerase